MTEVAIPTGLAASGVPPRAVKVYAALAAHGWEKNIRTEDVATLAGVSWVTADRAIRDLVDGGWLTAERVPGGGGE